MANYATLGHVPSFKFLQPQPLATTRYGTSSDSLRVYQSPVHNIDELTHRFLYLKFFFATYPAFLKRVRVWYLELRLRLRLVLVLGLPVGIIVRVGHHLAAKLIIKLDLT